ncbi:hypothetical protein PIIN_04724 [Serendipita indica DSM 11827]|uniref:Uncharacterized protein n=1 Tax=Serendipita indica (strain DSM 11827) TaxID=1109443 RepID=G4THJ6_SERID|nr:hypothetical protein PIIN_04724 [Serendipita indica DSM 11827]
MVTSKPTLAAMAHCPVDYQALSTHPTASTVHTLHTTGCITRTKDSASFSYPQRTTMVGQSTHFIQAYDRSKGLSTESVLRATRAIPALHLTPATVRSMVVACMIPLAATLQQYAMRLERHQIYFVGAGLVLLVLLSLVIADGDGCDLVGYSPMNRDIFDARSPIPEVVPFGSMSPLIRNEYDARSPLFSH